MRWLAGGRGEDYLPSGEERTSSRRLKCEMVLVSFRWLGVEGSELRWRWMLCEMELVSGCRIEHRELFRKAHQTCILTVDSLHSNRHVARSRHHYQTRGSSCTGLSSHNRTTFTTSTTSAGPAQVQLRISLLLLLTPVSTSQFLVFDLHRPRHVVVHMANARVGARESGSRLGGRCLTPDKIVWGAGDCWTEGKKQIP